MVKGGNMVSSMVFTDSVTFEKLKMVACEFTDMLAIRESLSLESYTDIVLNALVSKLKAYVLAEEVDRRSKTIKFTVDMPANWWQHFKKTVFPKRLLSRFPVKYYKVERVKRVTFRKLATYPKANIVFPDKMGDCLVYRTQIFEDGK